jgi:DNA polymerase-3 subunit alpha
MANAPFIHLHCHTDYSLLDGACSIPKLMSLAERQEMPAIAMTDHGNLFGAVEFYEAAKAKGIKPLIGCEVYVSQKGRHVRNESDRYNHLLLLCKDLEGYRNLIDLVSTGYLDGFYYKPRIDKDLLASKSKGLICTSACLRGDLNEALLNKGYEEGRRLAYTYLDIFGKDNFYLEVQDHGLDLDKQLLPQVFRLSRETGIPMVATNDAHYLTKDDARAHEALLCIQTGKTLSDPNRMRFSTDEFYIKSREEMLALFDGDSAPLDRTWEISEQCNLTLDKVDDPFPAFEVPEGHSADTYFEWVARQGLEERKSELQALQAAGRLKHELVEYNERLDHEIHIIQQMKYSGYFLIVWDFIRFARGQKIPVGPGRGSAAGSLVAYAMRITNMDPLQYGLLFERFLNPERISMPDIDIDFCMHRRGEVIQYVTERYGREQVAQIITFNTLQAKAAIKDVGRVMDMTFTDVDRLTKMVPNVLNIKLADALKQEPKLAARAKNEPEIGRLMEMAQRLEGVSRNPSVHAAGVVIAPRPLRELIPLYKTAKDEIVTQYDMKSLDKLSLLKMDFLGLTTLTVIEEAQRLLKEGKGIELNPDQLPLDDKDTYALLGKGLTSGVFQFESEGMRDILRRYQPERLEDLIALNALYRPGPIQGGMVSDFIDRRHGRKPVTYALPVLKDILEETYGVIVYQEQVMQIANRVAGYSLGEADLLRRAMGKKKAEEMAAQRERFLNGALEREYPKHKVIKLFDLMEQFAGYGFNKSHSAAYGFVAFLTAYLKAHHPIYFMAALLSSETNNTDKVVRYINECSDMGIEILPPDCNSSDWNFTPAGENTIRFGMGAIKNVGKNAVKAIMRARNEEGSFRSLYHFAESVDWTHINKRMMESAIKAGAFDSLGGHRAQLIAALDRAVELGQQATRDRLTGQGGLFATLKQEASPSDDALPEVPEWPEKDKLTGEKEMLGFYVTGHPLNAYREKIAELTSQDSACLAQLDQGTPVALCGVLTGITRRRNREGRPWVAATLEDLKGSIELLVFANSYEDLSPQLEEDKSVLLRGSLRMEENAAPKVAVTEIVPLDNARISLPKQIMVTVQLGGENTSNGLSRAELLHKLFQRRPGDTDVRLRLMKSEDFLISYDLSDRVQADRTLCKQIEEICGSGSVEVIPG